MKMRLPFFVLIVITLLYSANTTKILSNIFKQFQNLSQINLTALPDNSLFTKWRPTYHFASPNSWMNDPCGPLYDPATETYHLYYQVQPGHVEWGNISWGHAKSKDMIIWEDVTSWRGYDYITLTPGIGNNQSILGVFTGSTLPVTITGDLTKGTITTIYTSVKYLPISWNGPYHKGSETQSLAISYDGGVTYQQYANNPILAAPPEDMNVTGWRDPKFEQWPELDIVLYGSNQEHYYMTISSGIRGVGPRLLLYQASINDLTDWTYLGPLISVSGNYTFNEIWSGSFGYNFEVSNTFSLLEKAADGGDNYTIHTFAALGTEGGNTTLHQSLQWSIWIKGNLIKTGNGSPTMNIVAAGVADWGDAYALNSFYDPKGDRRIFYGWIKEAHKNYGQRAFGYNGQITLPREVFVQVYKNVVNISGSLSKQGPWILISNTNGTYTCKTLGIRPINEVTKLRYNSTFINLASQTFNQSTKFTSFNIFSSNFELKANINISSNAAAGFVFRRSSDGLEYTTLIYDPVSEYLILNRTYSSLITQFDHSPVYAKHTLLTRITNKNTIQKELLSLHIFLDNSLLEVYANNRTVMATHIYPTLSDATGLGYIVDRDDGPVTFNNVFIWSNLQNAFPYRPANSSITLVADSDNITSTSSPLPYFYTSLFFLLFFVQ
nr:putative GH32 family protein [Macrotrachela quadricornifera]